MTYAVGIVLWLLPDAIADRLAPWQLVIVGVIGLTVTIMNFGG